MLDAGVPGTGLYTGDSVSFGSIFKFDYQAVIQQAFELWSAVANIEFVQVEDPGVAIGQSAFADIRISAGTIDGVGNTLGQAYLPTPNGKSSLIGDIALDKAETWSEHSLLLVVAHEIGHSLGLEHETITTAIMNPYYNGTLTGLQQDDIDGIRTIYGAQDNGPATYALTSDRADITLLQGTDQLTLVGNALSNSIHMSGKAETIRGGTGDDTISGGGGDDTIYGDFVGAGGGVRAGSGSYQRTSADANTTRAAAVDLGDYFAAAQSSDVLSTTGPHVTVTGTGDGAVHYYAVDITGAGSRIVVDVDSSEIFFDPYLVLYGPDGSVVASNDNSPVSSGGTGSFIDYDSYIDYTTTAAGRYVIAIGSSLGTSAGAMPANSLYTFHVSVDGELNGNDSIAGDAGNDALFGGGGDDVLFGGIGSDTLDGGQGYDWASYADAAAALTISLSDPALNTGDAQLDTFVSIENVRASAYADALTGDAADNALEGGAGADTLNGGAGSDTASYAHAAGGVTASLVTAGGSSGDAAGDVYNSIENLTGSQGDDDLTGDGAANRLEGAGGNDTLSGGEGDDTLVGGGGSNQLSGGLGVDMVSYSAASEGVSASLVLMLGSAGAGSSDVYDSIEAISGSRFADALTGNAASNSLSGEAGDDTLVGGAGADSLSGGAGTDWASYAGAASGVVVSLQTGGTAGEAAGDTLISIENVRGSSFNDALSGDGRSNVLVGAGGKDTLVAGAGDDTLIGSAGGDSIDGGVGNDVVSYEDATAGIVVSVGGVAPSGGSGAISVLTSVERIIGSAFDDTVLVPELPVSIDGRGGADTVSFAPATAGITLNLGTFASKQALIGIEALVGSTFADKIMGKGTIARLSGGDGNDTLSGGAGSDTLDGGAGIDTISYGDISGGIVLSLADPGVNTGDAAADTLSGFENVIGTLGHDDLRGDASSNDLNGNQGSDTLSGAGGNDMLRGGAQADRLSGGEGNDRLEGGTELDTLEGGAGNDTYVLDDSGDVIIEAADAGSDTVWTGLSSLDLRTLTSIENAALTGSGSFNLIGSAVGNVLTGNAGANGFAGQGGNDTINGGDGVDTAVFAGMRADYAVTYNSASATYTVTDLRANPQTGIDQVKNVEFLRFNDGSFDPSTILNRAPTGTPTTVLAAGTEDTAYTFSRASLLAGISDPDGNALSLKTLTASKGVLTDNGDGTYTIAPPANYTGSVTLTYSVTDGMATLWWLTRTFTLAAVNDAPTTLALSASAIAEGAVNGTVIGTFSTNDPDFGDTLTYTLLDNAGGRFAVQGGRLVVASGAMLDFEQATSHSVSVRVSDKAGASYQATFNVSVQDVASESVTGNWSDNLLLGGSGADVFSGASGNDTLKGQGGADSLSGDDGSDVLIGGLGADRLSGGNGADTVSYTSGVVGVSVDLAANTGAGGEADGDTFSGIEGLAGTRFGDSLSGDALANTLMGYGGNDTLSGRDGNDVLAGGLGADSLSGGNGVDTASYAEGTVGVTVDLAANTGIGGEAAGDTFSGIEGLSGTAFADVLSGDALGNTLVGNAGNDTLSGREGNDVLAGGLGADSLDGGIGTDIASYAASATAVSVNLALGTGTSGEAAGDILTSVENVVGSKFADVIVGSAGANGLDGGEGSDTIAGGAGADIFAVTTAPGSWNIDTITDFSAADDTIRLENGVMPGLTATGVLPMGAFLSGAAAADADDRIVYNATTGALFYDADGLGGVTQVQIAKLSTGLTLTAADFVVV